jgi:hypothetical protein
MATYRFKQSIEEVRKVLTEELPKVLAPVRINFIPLENMAPEEQERADSNMRVMHVYLGNNFAVDGIVDGSFDTIYRSYMALKQAKMLQFESAPTTKPQGPVLVSTSGRVNHAHRDLLKSTDSVTRQREAEQSAKDQHEAKLMWQHALEICGNYQWKHGKNYARNEQGKKILYAIFKPLYTAGSSSKAQAGDCIRQLQAKERQLEEELVIR